MNRCGYVIESHGRLIYFAGDTAYGNHFAQIRKRTPVIEWFADHAPQKRMGVFGVVLILIGFGFQSLQYWAALLDVPIR